MNGTVDAMLWKIKTETAGIGEDSYFRTAAVLHTKLAHTFGRKVGEMLHIINCMKSSGTAPGTRRERNPTTEKQYFPMSGNQPGTAEKEATGGRTQPAQEKKPGFWNEYVNIQIYTCVRDVCSLFFDTEILGFHTGGFIYYLYLFGSIRLSIRICIF